MKYQVTVAGHSFEVVLSGEEVRVDGKAVVARMLKDAGSAQVMLLDGRVINLSFDRFEDHWVVRRSGDVAEVTVDTDRDRLLKRFSAGAGTGGRGGLVRAPMPGLVIRLLVAEGDPVEKGQGLLVLEAMKMENEIKSPITGMVGPLEAEPGSVVEKGALLLEVIPEG